MAKFSLKLTKRYLRDLKLARKRGMDESLLNEIIGKLLNDEPASDLDINKQEQLTPLTDVNLLNCLLSCLNILPVFIRRETRAESSSYLKSTNGNLRRTIPIGLK